MSVLDTVDIKVTLLDKLRDDTVPHKRAILHYNVSVNISRLWLALLLPFLHHGQSVFVVYSKGNISVGRG